MITEAEIKVRALAQVLGVRVDERVFSAPIGLVPVKGKYNLILCKDWPAALDSLLALNSHRSNLRQWNASSYDRRRKT